MTITLEEVAHAAGVLVMHYIWPGLYEAIKRRRVPALGIHAEPVPGMPIMIRPQLWRNS